MSDTLDLGALQNLLERIRGLKIACVGDLMLDRYVYGEVSRISPEAPIPVLRAARTVAMPGGVGNVARNIAALGLSPRERRPRASEFPAADAGKRAAKPRH